MPSRLVNGDAIGTSAALLRVNPVRYRAEFALLLTLSEANGVFECDAALIYQRLYVRNRPDILGPLDVRDMLQAYDDAKMLFRWEEQGKVWGHWVNQNKPGRLPAKSRVKTCHHGVAPVEVPASKLAEWLTARLTNGYRGLGLGLGLGLGTTKPTAAAPPHTPCGNVEKSKAQVKPLDPDLQAAADSLDLNDPKGRRHMDRIIEEDRSRDLRAALAPVAAKKSL